jgi:hypothetical protein
MEKPFGIGKAINDAVGIKHERIVAEHITDYLFDGGPDTEQEDTETAVRLGVGEAVRASWANAKETMKARKGVPQSVRESVERIKAEEASASLKKPEAQPSVEEPKIETVKPKPAVESFKGRFLRILAKEEKEEEKVVALKQEKPEPEPKETLDEEIARLEREKGNCPARC